MKKIGFSIILFLILLFLYARYYDTYGITVKEYAIYDAKLPSNFEGLKVIHFSDVLFKDKNDFEEIQLVVDKINSLNPDIIIFTGDLIEDSINKNEKKELQKIIKSLKSNLYNYFVSGDNDNKDSIEILENANFIYLNNLSQFLFKDGEEPILMVGGNKITDEVFQKAEEVNYNYVMTLIHNPDDYEYVSNKSTVVFAGHSLGGQIRVPFWGALIKKDGANIYTNDFYEKDNSQLYVSYGIGTEITPFRMFNKPSINVYRLYSK